MKTARSIFEEARISPKDSLILAKELKDLNVEKAKNFLSGLIDNKRSLNHKHYSLAAKKFLEVLANAEASAKQKNLDLDRTFVKVAKSNEGAKMMFPKSRAKFRGRKAKVTNLEIILEER